MFYLLFLVRIGPIWPMAHGVGRGGSTWEYDGFLEWKQRIERGFLAKEVVSTPPRTYQELSRHFKELTISEDRREEFCRQSKTSRENGLSDYQSSKIYNAASDTRRCFKYKADC